MEIVLEKNLRNEYGFLLKTISHLRVGTCLFSLSQLIATSSYSNGPLPVMAHQQLWWLPSSQYATFQTRLSHQPGCVVPLCVFLP